ncbi:MAG TPA: dUTP diphosphatase, partial [Tabrizicola sp.]|nr:dUTP diphosphatase [Tabrizicola sp.]
MGPVVRVLWEDWADRSLPLPVYQTAGAAGADLCANFPEGERVAGLVLPPMGRAICPTGIRVA